jgi:hypothetical protein
MICMTDLSVLEKKFIETASNENPFQMIKRLETLNKPWIIEKADPKNLETKNQ